MRENSDYPQWTIGQLAKQAGCSVETVRHYERIGLLQPPRRSDGGYRLYGPDALERLSFIRRSRDLGFSQAQIRDMLAAMSGRDDAAEVVGEVIRRRLEEVRASLRELARVEGALAAAVRELPRLCEEEPLGPAERRAA